ncbi:glycosyltransferase [Dechloromonas agitata]|uniref:glycosyltransferase family 2 protein n=1 Tax=Dechloromonas agitata TaxID=73030 RepID=UPI00237E16DF|nr:glycosyltransferase family 2 protein [Dechloromonas agitata]MDE1546556.1 glycosyltransferase [Dechloromonas agitata]
MNKQTPQKNPSVLDIAVVIPTYNRSALIVRALESVRKQSHLPTQIIVVDDASTDDTVGVVRAWAEEHEFPVVVDVLERNSGPAVARNRGIELATTQYIAFLDSDDEYVSNTLYRLSTPFNYFPDAVLSFSDATVVNENCKVLHGLFRPNIKIETETTALEFHEFEIRSLNNPTETLLKASIIPTPSTCFRRSDAIAVGMMPSSFRAGEDWLFWLRLAERGKFIFQLDDLVLNYRHNENLTRPNAAEFVAREKLRGYLALESGSAGVSLSDEQLRTVIKFRVEQLHAWHYHLSRLGLSAYLNGLSALWLRPLGSVLIQLVFNPKSLIRAIVSSLHIRIF